jgi:hypothetical protein
MDRQEESRCNSDGCNSATSTQGPAFKSGQYSRSTASSFNCDTSCASTSYGIADSAGQFLKPTHVEWANIESCI